MAKAETHTVVTTMQTISEVTKKPTMEFTYKLFNMSRAATERAEGLGLDAIAKQLADK